MSLGKGLINVGLPVCRTDSVYPFGPDNNFTSNVALYQLDSDGGTTNNVPDTTTNNNGTASNITYSSGYINNAAVFNGSSSRIQIASTSTDPVNISTGTFSISMWVNMDNLTNNNKLVYKWGTTDANRNFLFTVLSSSGFLYFIEGSTTGDVIRQGTFALSINTWHHIAVTREQGGDLKMYVDGGLKNTFSATATFKTSSEPIYLGYQVGQTTNFTGKIDEVRIFDREINASEVATLYAETSATASSINPLNEGQGVALYNLDFDATESGDLYPGIATDVTFGVGGAIGNYGARFNGSSSQITTGLDIPHTSDFSVSFWVKIDTFGNDVICTDGSFDTTPELGFGFQALTTGSKIIFYVASGSNLFNAQVSSLSTDTWYHVVGVCDLTNNIKLYINGNLEQTTTYTSASRNDRNNFRIGRDHSTGGRFFPGDLDQIRVFSSSLTSSQVSTLYAETACVHTATTTDNYFPLADGSSDAVAYYKLDNSAEDSVSTNDGTETDIEYRFGRYGQAAVFNGSSSLIALSTTSNPFGDNDTIKAISAWVKLHTTTSKGIVYTVSSSSNSNDYFTMQVRGDSNKVYIHSRNGSSSNSFIDEVAITPDTNWHHYVFQLGSTEREIYIDGVKQTLSKANTGSATDTSWISYPTYDSTTHSDIGIGRRSSAYYADMDLDQVRIFSTALNADQVSQLYNEKPETDTSNFKTVLYEGTGSTQYISNVGMDLETNGGLVWIKNRDKTHSNTLYDSVRGTGTTKAIYSDLTVAEGTYTTLNNFVSFDANGFTVGSTTSTNILNFSGDDFVSWVWLGGGPAVSNTNGTITSQVSANQDAGFSIVKYTGDSSATMTIGHGLSQSPQIVISKRLDTSQDWGIYTNVSTGNNTTNWLSLNNTNAYGSGNFMNLSSTLLSAVATGAFWIQGSQIAYCWHSVSGYSKIGFYEGGTGNVTVSDIGFKPSFVMIKNVDSAADWVMLDNRRNTIDDRLDSWLRANSSAIEANGVGSAYITVNDNGFVVNSTTSFGTNNNGDTYLYMAFK